MPTAFDKPVVCPRQIGRDDQLDALRQVAASVATGAGQTVLVAGEAGIGKSRLVRELAERLGRDGWVVQQGRRVPIVTFRPRARATGWLPGPVVRWACRCRRPPRELADAVPRPPRRALVPPRPRPRPHAPRPRPGAGARPAPPAAAPLRAHGHAAATLALGEGTLAALAAKLPDLARVALVFRPATLLRWHREIDNRPQRERPPVAAACVELIVRLARETPSWGYGKLQGELHWLLCPSAPISRSSQRYGAARQTRMDNVANTARTRRHRRGTCARRACRGRGPVKARRR